MLYKHFDNQGEEIEIYFNNAEGFVVDKTPLKYKGIKIGIVSSIEVDEKNINRFLVRIAVDKKALNLVAKKGTKFWKVEPKATLTEISGLNTIFSGIYIEAMPSAQNIEQIKDLEEQHTFNAVSEKPINYLQDGLFLDLKSSNGTLEVGAPILYKSFLVGKIVKKNLKDNNIFYTIFIEEEYKDLVKEDSSFWNISAIDLKASLSGIKFKVNTLASLIAGGIAFDSNEFKRPTLKDTNKSV
ncbi:MAG: MlaD family protein [Halarcobacter ebronensis]